MKKWEPNPSGPGLLFFGIAKSDAFSSSSVGSRINVSFSSTEIASEMRFPTLASSFLVPHIEKIENTELLLHVSLRG